MRQKLALGIILVLASLGVFALSIGLHELTHVIHGGNTVTALCVDLNQKISDGQQEGFLFAHTAFDSKAYKNVETFSTFRELSEKYAHVVQYLVMIGLSFWVGILVAREKKSVPPITQ